MKGGRRKTVMGAGKRKNDLKEEMGIWRGKGEFTGEKDDVGGS